MIPHNHESHDKLPWTMSYTIPPTIQSNDTFQLWVTWCPQPSVTWYPIHEFHDTPWSFCRTHLFRKSIMILHFLVNQEWSSFPRTFQVLKFGKVLVHCPHIWLYFNLCTCIFKGDNWLFQFSREVIFYLQWR